MIKQSRLIMLAIAICSLMAVKCSNNTNKPGPVSNEPTQANNEPANTDANADGFSDGHRLSGRYVNTDGGIRSFTFSTDGSFIRAGATSGDFRGGNYATGSHDSGTYHLKGRNMNLTYENGDTDDLPIEIFSYNDQNDYSLESPAQIKIHHVLYAHDN